MNADASGLRRLRQASEATGGQESTAPAWSPDGRRILFAGSPGLGGRVSVVNADGSGERTLAKGGHAAWSPDGRRIVFVSTPGGRRGDVYVMNADGSARRNLTPSPSFDRSPVWSPDGRRIAFVSRRDGNSEVYVVNADGSRQRRLTRTPWNDGSPAWSPAQKK